MGSRLGKQMDPSLLSVRVGRLVVDVTSAIRKRSVFDPWCCLPFFLTGLFADYVGARGAASPKREPFHPRGCRVVRRVISLKFMGDALTSLFGEALNSFGILAAGSQTIVGFDCDTIR
jgi:hypothetical protein